MTVTIDDIGKAACSYAALVEEHGSAVGACEALGIDPQGVVDFTNAYAEHLDITARTDVTEYQRRALGEKLFLVGVIAGRP